MSYLWSLILIGAGAVLRYAVEPDLWSSVNEDIVGMILIVIGAIGFLFSLFVVTLVGNTTRAIRDIQKDSMSQSPLRVRGRKTYKDR